MANIYQSIKSHFTPEVTSKISSLLGESDSQVKSALGTAIPALLAGFLEKGNTSKMKNLLEDTYKKNVLHEKDGIFTDKGHEKLALGEKFLMEASEGRESAFISPNDMMSSAQSKKLLVMASTVVAGFLAKRLNANGNSLDKVLDEVGSERNAILSDISSEYRNCFKLADKRVEPIRETRAAIPPKKKGNLGWLWTILGLIALLLLLWWGMRSCNSCRRVKTPPVVTEVIDTVKKVITGREKYELALPDGKIITVFRGGMEDQMITFLHSDAYKTGSGMDMRNHWFEFDNLNFEYNSGTQLTEGSQVQVDNLVAILTHYPDTKIKIGGHADLKGQPRPNMVISEQRANTIKRLMVAAGISADRISTEGFGEETAVIPASATNDERAPDRDIAIRFMK